MEWIFKLVEVFICVLEAYLMFDFYKSFFSVRECFRKKYVNVAAVVITAVCVRLVNTLGSSTVNIVAMQVIYLTLLFGVFVGNALRKVFCYVIATTIMIGSEFLWIVVMSLPADFSMGQVQDNQLVIYVTLLGVKTVAFVLFNIVKRTVKSANGKMRFSTFLLYSILPIATLGIMVALAYLNIDFDSLRLIHGMLIICTILAVMGNIIIFYIFDAYIFYTEKLRHQEVLITRMELEEKRYEQIELVNHEHAGFIHDIRHYMRTIGELATEKHNEGILAILSELQIKVSDAETKIYCPNRMLNTILNEKKKEADENGINMKINISPDFAMDFLENIDLIAIMGNLLDNAIEAAKQCEQGYINIGLQTKNSGHFSVISMENSYVGEILVKDDEIVTGKEDKAKHGYGIKNVDAIAQKYNGYLQNSFEDGVFTSIVVLPNPMV